MRQTYVCAAFVMALFASAAAAGPGDPCTPWTEQQRLETLLGYPEFHAYVKEETGADLARGSYVLAYDHVYDRWTAYQVGSAGLAVSKPDLTTNGDTVSVELPSKTGLLVFLTRSNPLLFRASSKPVTVEDSRDVESLKKLASLAANFLTGFTKHLGTRAVPAGVVPTTELANIATAAIGPAVRLGDAATELERTVTSIVTDNDRAVAYTQMVEIGRDFTSPLPALDNLRRDPARAQQSFDAVRSAAAELNAVLQAYCGDLIGQSRAAAALYDADYEKALAKLNADPAKASDEDQDAVNKVDFAVRNLSLSPVCTGRSAALWKELQAEAAQHRGPAAFRAVVDIADAVTSADELLAKEPATLKIAGWLGDFADIAMLYHASSSSGCALIDQPIVVRGGSFSPAAGKKFSGGFTIATTLDPAAMHLSHPATVDKKIEVSSTSKWGIGAGLVYSTDKENNWTLIDKDGGKVISPRRRETFAGQTAVFGNFHPGRWTAGPAQFGVQMGVPTDTDRPAIFVGPSLDVGKWLRIGAGYGFHKNRKLSRGEVEGQAPSDGGADVPTRDYYSGGFYVGLSLSLDGVPLFKAD